jgi:hypothetical protein
MRPALPQNLVDVPDISAAGGTADGFPFPLQTSQSSAVVRGSSRVVAEGHPVPLATLFERVGSIHCESEEL